ncbi:MAG TPA: acylneuraminate cytidylyltransferase family protein [Tepidisphaeraceae bacterium]|nr:acylneuraminate cytidylyltransferase family protein [Tepidisphaeraceae bacterium]
MRTLGVILARSGSVGLANKHMLPLLGRPVIEYTFDHARSSLRLTDLVVSSDCPLIRRAAAGAGIHTIARPAELATADASVQAVLLHAMRTVEAARNVRFDAIVTLYGNVPLRGDGVIDRALEALESSGCDSVRTFTPVGKWHPAWMSRLNDGNVEALHRGSIHRRQDLEPLFLHDGAVVAVTRASMLLGESNPDDPHAFFGMNRRGIQTPMGETIEIDHLRDLYWAEATLRERQAVEEAHTTRRIAS